MKLLLKEIKGVINAYFIKNFFGVSGVSLSCVECERADFTEPKRYKELRDKISKAVELEKI